MSTKLFGGGQFELQSRLGEGTFGIVYRGVHVTTGEQVAIKLEETDCERLSPLVQEAERLKQLARPEKVQGFAEYFCSGREGPYHCIVMELLGASLQAMQVKIGGVFTPKTTVLVAQQLLHRIEYLHSKGIVHGDIKPDNFLLGVGNKAHHLHVIDFGLSSCFWDGQQHRAPGRGKKFTGTARYASINATKCYEQSRRDDLESIGNMLMFFMRGSLPWSGLTARSETQKLEKIALKKESTPVSELCAGYPDAFEEYLLYTRKLSFTQRPDYAMLQGFLSIARERQGCPMDHEFEWLDDIAPTDDLVPLTVIKSKQPDDEAGRIDQTTIPMHSFALHGGTTVAHGRVACRSSDNVKKLDSKRCAIVRPRSEMPTLLGSLVNHN
jgi:serine/threonine protein kinase